jgi:hypothetical protein
MRQVISYFLDEMGLFLLHRKKSKSSQFRKSDRLKYEELMKAYPSPAMPEITFQSAHVVGRYEVGAYFYPCQIKGGLQEDPMAAGRYYIPKLPDKEPVHVIVVHGWRSDSIDRVKNIFLDPLTKLGYHLYFVTLPHHMERSSAADYSGEYMVSADINRTIQTFRQAVTEIRALIHWLKKHRSGKVVLVGVSLGGLVVNLTSLVEEQIDLLIPIMYANRLSHAIWNTPVGKHIKKDLESHGFTESELQACWAILEPGNGKSQVSKENMLFILGLYDRYVEKQDADRLWEAWDQPKRLLYPCGHAGIVFKREQIAADVAQFIQSRLY